jgi:hypothetical protein
MKQLTKKQLAERVTVTCYGRKESMTREQAIDKYYEGMTCCDGSERDRYMTIYCQLLEGFRQVSDEE